MVRITNKARNHKFRIGENHIWKAEDEQFEDFEFVRWNYGGWWESLGFWGWWLKLRWVS